MTAEEVLREFKKCRLSINVKGASAEEMRQVQEITGLKWLSGHNLDDPQWLHFLLSDSYLHNNPGMHSNESLTRAPKRYGAYALTMTEFLSLFTVNIDENEYKKVFGE